MTKKEHIYRITTRGIKRCTYCGCKAANKASKESCKGQYKEVKNENIST